MKLIHLISGGDVGGAKTHVLSLLQGLNRTEDVHLICFMEGPFAEEARCLGIPTTVIEGSNPMAVRKRILAIIRHDDCQLLQPEIEFGAQDYGVATKKGCDLSKTVDDTVKKLQKDGWIDEEISKWGLL